ncbi:MAG: M23 family metallopeptidase [Pseudomonadota bacterium]
MTDPVGSNRSNGARIHAGIDFGSHRPKAAPILGVPVIAPLDGMIIYKKYQRGYGHILALKPNGYEDGRLTFSHLQGGSIPFPKEQWVRVKKGQRIARVGGSGGNYLPHLHMEARIGHYQQGKIIDIGRTMAGVRNAVQVNKWHGTRRSGGHNAYIDLSQNAAQEFCNGVRSGQRGTASTPAPSNTASSNGSCDANECYSPSKQRCVANGDVVILDSEENVCFCSPSPEKSDPWSCFPNAIPACKAKGQCFSRSAFKADELTHCYWPDQEAYGHTCIDPEADTVDGQWD